MVHVNNFLGYVKIETGGIIIAWFHVIYYALLFLYFTIILLLSCFYDRQELSHKMMMSYSTDFISTVSLSKLRICLIVCALISIAVVIAAYRSIKRNYETISPMMIALASITFATLYVILFQIWLAPRIWLILTISIFGLYFYFFLVIYSLYRVFRKEFERIVPVEIISDV